VENSTTQTRSECARARARVRVCECVRAHVCVRVCVCVIVITAYRRRAAAAADVRDNRTPKAHWRSLAAATSFFGAFQKRRRRCRTVYAYFKCRFARNDVRSAAAAAPAVRRPPADHSPWDVRSVRATHRRPAPSVRQLAARWQPQTPLATAMSSAAAAATVAAFGTTSAIVDRRANNI